MSAKKVAAKKVGSTKPKMEELIVDEAYLATHPELVEEGVSVGDTIEIPAPPEKSIPEGSGDGFAIVQNGQFVRVYEDEEMAEQYCNKPGRTGARVVPESSINKIKVSYILKNAKTGVDERAERMFSTADGEDFKADALVFAHANRGSAEVTL